MNTSQSLKTFPSTTDEKIPDWELTYFSRLAQSLIFDALISAFSQEAKAGRTSRSKLAKRIGKKPEQITRMLASPTNLQAKTLGILLRGLDAKVDRLQVTFFRAIADQRTNHPTTQPSKKAVTATSDTLKAQTKYPTTDRIDIYTGSSPTLDLDIVELRELRL